jgi:competence protein ComEC
MFLSSSPSLCNLFSSTDCVFPSRAICEMNLVCAQSQHLRRSFASASPTSVPSPSGTATRGCARFPKLYKLIALAALALIALPIFSFPQSTPPNAATPKPLQIYFIDVEGGQATLFVTPEGQSLLIDTGWPGNNFRDADRIVAAAKDAGISKLDYVLITHYHDDHVGGAPQLAQRIPIGTFIDHGENREPASQKLYDAYKALLDSGKYQHIIAKPGDVLPIQGIHAEVITSDGAVIQTPLAGAGQSNPYCANSPSPPVDTTENPRSLGVLITFGQLCLLDLGDLTADKERELMCPINRIGKIDIYVASHHGFNQSGSTVLVHAIAPRVAIVDNGATKGGSPQALDDIRNSPGIEGIWQLHYSKEADTPHNTSFRHIVNLQGTDAGNYLSITSESDGAVTIFNPRTKKTEHYDFGKRALRK